MLDWPRAAHVCSRKMISRDTMFDDRVANDQLAMSLCSSHDGEMTARPITPAQSRAARALLDISNTQLSSLVVIPRVVIEEFEAGGAPLSEVDFAALRHAFERAGVVFLDGNGGGPGMRLRK